MDDIESKLDPEKRKRIVENLDRTVASGRFTPDEAARLRAAADPAGFDGVILEVRTRHARTSVAAAVEAGQLSADEADAFLERLSSGEHSSGLHAELGKLRRGVPASPEPVRDLGHTYRPHDS